MDFLESLFKLVGCLILLTVLVALTPFLIGFFLVMMLIGRPVPVQRYYRNFSHRNAGDTANSPEVNPRSHDIPASMDIIDTEVISSENTDGE